MNTFRQLIEAMLDYDGLFYVVQCDKYVSKKEGILAWISGLDVELHPQ